MQNPHVKYLKTKKGYFYLFYSEHGSIFSRGYTAEGWTTPQKIAEKTAPVFSLCQYGDLVYLLYSSGEGQLFLASSRDFRRGGQNFFSSPQKTLSMSSITCRQNPQA